MEYILISLMGTLFISIHTVDHEIIKKSYEIKYKIS